VTAISEAQSANQHYTYYQVSLKYRPNLWSIRHRSYNVAQYPGTRGHIYRIDILQCPLCTRTIHQYGCTAFLSTHSYRSHTLDTKNTLFCILLLAWFMMVTSSVSDCESYGWWSWLSVSSSACTNIIKPFSCKVREFLKVNRLTLALFLRITPVESLALVTLSATESYFTMTLPVELKASKEGWKADKKEIRKNNRGNSLDHLSSIRWFTWT